MLVTSMHFSSEKGAVLLGDESGNLGAYSLATKEEIFSIQPPGNESPVLHIGMDDEVILAVYGNGAVCKYKFHDQSTVSSVMCGPATKASVCENVLATCDGDVVQYWDMRSGQQIFRWFCPRSRVSNVYIGESLSLVSNETVGTIYVFDLEKLAWERTLNVLNDVTVLRTFSGAASHLVAIGSRAGLIRVQDLRAGGGSDPVPKIFREEGDSSVDCMDATPSRLVTGSSTGRIAFWDPSYCRAPISTFHVPKSHPLPLPPLTHLQIGKNDTQIAAAWRDGTISLWDVSP